MDLSEKELLRELSDLIAIRQYVVNATNNPTIDRTTVNVVNGMLLLLDKKILGLLQSNEFKAYVNYDDVQNAKQEAAFNSNLRFRVKK
jgi:hypothetical protein